MFDLKDFVKKAGAVDSSACLIDTLLPDLQDGVQLWDSNAQLLTLNEATLNHFRLAPNSSPGSLEELLSNACDENNRPVKASDNPVSRVFERAESQKDFIIQVSGPEPIWLKFSAYPIFDTESNILAVLSFTHEISLWVEKGKQLELDAYFDSLTGLPNRMLLLDRMQQAMAHSSRVDEILAICLMDLDGFKKVNDSLGHHAGDLLLKEAARRMLGNLRAEDTAIRLGGDEFILLIGGFKHETDTLDAIQRMNNIIAVPYQINGEQVRVTASIGVTLYPSDTNVSDQLIRHADQAMYKAKEKGKNCFHLFDPAVESKIRANKEAVNSIAKAIQKNQLHLYYQPKVDCLSGNIVGLEAMVRWRHPILGVIRPPEFLPLIEHDDMIIKLGEWVIDTALHQIQSWREQGIDTQVSVNIAARHLMRGDFRGLLDSLIKRFPSEILQKLEIEILETAALEDINTVSKLIDHYHTQGITFALDDFGTGFSSLAHLKHLTADTLKIDRSFVHDMHSDPGNLGIIQGIIGLADAFQREVVAEGVESIEQALMLIELGCTTMQGYSIAQPMPADRIPEWINLFTPDPRWRLAYSHYPDRNDFELLLLQVIHRHWMEQIKAACNHDKTWADIQQLAYRDCRITKWYEGEEMQRYRDSSEIKKIVAEHKAVHHCAQQLMDSDISQQADRFDETLIKLTRHSENLMTHLQNFRRKYALKNLNDKSEETTKRA